MQTLQHSPIPPSLPSSLPLYPQEDYEKHQDKCKPRALVIDGPTLMLASKEGVRRRLLKLTRVRKEGGREG